MADAAGKTAAPGRARRRAGSTGDRAGTEATPLRGRIPSLRAAQAEALRGFFSAPQSWYLKDNGLLHFMPGAAAAAGEAFELDAEGTRVGLRLQVAEVVAGDGLHWSDYSGRSRVLAWSLAHEPHLMRLSEALGVALAPLLDTDPETAAGDDAVWLDFVIDDDTGDAAVDAGRRPPPVQGALRLPAAWLDRVLTRAEPPVEGEPPPPLGRWRELPAGVSLRLTPQPLRADEWAALHPGDVIVVGRRDQPPRLEAHACGRLWPLATDPGGWRVAGPMQHPSTLSQETATMSEQETPAAEDAGSHDADADAGVRPLPVQVAFEIGRLEMRVGELSALQPGYVFALPARLEGTNVTIRANGEAVGQGELVAVGDTLGVRLLSWT
ncbi:type III secretion system cytoplasmic ring protein SctQ [Luteimonas sp. R10]|uniref:type III secretion system cytoplasmic ring protein SctQ n=1 Tax=Luteimonas sp. R10 TaxID=3108176 RepID=UPI003088F3A5|nr:type III secretion system cytoplasmic ring protein SctQ [Luteimonas sp. R10]